MDARDGRIYTIPAEDEASRDNERADFLKRLMGEFPMQEEDHAYIKPMAHYPTPKQRAAGKVGRNDPCPCGSGNKFKRCCLFRA